MPTFGQEIRKMRKNACLSLKVVAVCVGLSVTYVSQIERGDRPPPKRSFIRLWLKALKCPRKRSAELMRLAEEPRLCAVKLDPARDVANDVLRQLAKCYTSDSLPPVVWRKIGKLLTVKKGDKCV